MKVTVFGIGYVGLVQGAVLAEVGHDVVCIDIDANKVERLKQGHIPIYEPGLETLVKENYAAGRLSFTTDAAAGVKHGEVQFIAVGTPPDEDGSADLKYVLTVAETIAQHMERPQIIIDKSTVPVGTADKVSAADLYLLAHLPDLAAFQESPVASLGLLACRRGEVANTGDGHLTPPARCRRQGRRRWRR